jgi:hypothetical protein
MVLADVGSSLIGVLVILAIIVAAIWIFRNVIR